MLFQSEPKEKILHPSQKVRDVVLVFGQTGMGKTLWTRKYIRALKRVIILDPLSEYDGATTFEEFSDLVSHVESNNVFRVGYPNMTDFDRLCDLARCIDQCTLVCEESQRIIPPRMLLSESFEDLIYRGRHTRTSLILVAQRASTVNIAVRSQWSRMVTFRQTEPRDLSWIEDATGLEIEKEISGLDKWEYYDITPKSCELKRVTP